MPLVIGYFASIVIGLVILIITGPVIMLGAAASAVVLYGGFYLVLRWMGEFPGDQR